MAHEARTANLDGDRFFLTGDSGDPLGETPGADRDERDIDAPAALTSICVSRTTTQPVGVMTLSAFEPGGSPPHESTAGLQAYLSALGG